MKKVITRIAGVVCMFCMMLSTVNAGALIEEVDFSATTDVYSKYIWRGQNLGNDWAVQSGLSVSSHGFSFSVWANYNTGNNDAWTEVDYTLDYTTSLAFANDTLEKLSVSLGYIYYTFPNLSSDDSSQEIYFGFAFDCILDPSVTIYHDWDIGDGTYLEGGISHAFEVDRFILSPALSIGYNDGQWGFDSSFSAVLASVSISTILGEYVTAGATIAESIALDNQYNDEFYGGFNLSVDF